MAKLEQEVSTITSGGFDAVITDVVTSRATDQLEGYVMTSYQGQKSVVWDYQGICRDNPPDLNLDMHKPELAFVQTLKRQ